MSHEVVTVDNPVITIVVSDPTVTATATDAQVAVTISDPAVTLTASGGADITVNEVAVAPITVTVTDPTQPTLITVQVEAPLADSTVRLDDVGGGILYLGKAAPGTTESAAAWKISRVTEATDNDIDVVYAGGTANFDKVWDDHLILSYF